ncbi:MAG: restriction endonuclease subunit S [Prevotellaceae bacterium]|jgi:type I restriction enzyme S subunit|nr:restriction endonuclease subunit S [Prevotellaceae bacterium]
MTHDRKNKGNVPNLRFPEFGGEWEPFKIKDIIRMISGGTPSMQCSNYWNGDIPLISAQSMHNTYITSSTQSITDEGLAHGSKLLQKNNLLLLVRGSMLWKRIPICYNLVDVAFNQDVKGIVVNKKSISTFMLYWLQSKEPLLKSIVTGTSIGAGKLDSDNILSLYIYLPNKDEQSKISRLFFLLDERIATQNKIIEQYKSLIKGLIYTYLLGESNKYRKLGEFCQIKKGEQINRTELLKTGKYYVMNGGVTPSGFYHSFNTERNTISVSEGGNSCGYVQYNDVPFWSGGHCYTLEDIDKDIDDRYLFHYLKANEPQIMALRIGSGLPNIQKKDLSHFCIPMPSLLNQKEISDTLDKIILKIELEKSTILVYQKQKIYLLRNLFI